MFIPLVSWKNLLKRFNSVEEPIYCIAPLIVRWNIEPGASSSENLQNTVEQHAGGHTAVGQCATSLAGGIFGQYPRDRRQFPGIP